MRRRECEEFVDQASALAGQIAARVEGAILGPLHTAYVRGQLAGEQKAKQRIADVLSALRQWGDDLSPEQVRALRRALEGWG